MFHVLSLNVGFAMLFGHIFILVTELDGVRDNRNTCCAMGALMSFFYSAVACLLAMESFAVFKAIISGVIGGRTRVYLCYGWGLPFVGLGYNIFQNLALMGNDPRCMIGWENDVKWVFFIPMIAFGGFSFLVMLVVMCNINTPAMRKESIVEEMGSIAKGLFFLALLFALTWSWSPFAYIRFPYHEFPDFYPAFQVMNAFMGIFVFVFLGILSKRFRTVLTGSVGSRQKELLVNATGGNESDEELDDDTVVSDDPEDPMGSVASVRTTLSTPKSRPISARSTASQKSTTSQKSNKSTKSNQSKAADEEKAESDGEPDEEATPIDDPPAEADPDPEAPPAEV